MKIEFRTKETSGPKSHIECVVTTDCGEKVAFDDYVGSEGVGNILIEKLNFELLTSAPQLVPEVPDDALWVEAHEQPEEQESDAETVPPSTEA